MPDESLGGSRWGRLALNVALGELRECAREVGGDNRGPWVRKYLNGLAPEGSPWCAAFVSWCFAQNPDGMPFRYGVCARTILAQFKSNGWVCTRGAEDSPRPGDIVVWWRDKPDGWQAHVGFVHHLASGLLHTIEGNKAGRVRACTPGPDEMKRLLGYGRVPDAWRP